MKKSKFKTIDRCRVCGNKNLVEIINLGEQYLSGVFPDVKSNDNISKGPLILVKCHSEDEAINFCGLLQLKHSYDLDEMYGDNYGYRSGLNPSMVKHLNQKVQSICDLVELNTDDLIIDIGSNDGTTLNAYPEGFNLVGIDPTASKFKKYYNESIKVITEFFTDTLITDFYPNKKAKVVTSFSMFYDLEDPIKFAKQISNILDINDGIWVFEQSYMPLMLERTSFDTICHEHLEFYGFIQILWVLDNANLKAINVDFNDINGGSFSVVAAHKNTKRKSNSKLIRSVINDELNSGLTQLQPYYNFSKRVKNSCAELKEYVQKAIKEGKKIYGLGASTKGNVLLQYCGFSYNEISAIGEVNVDKFGKYTPGTLIPIVKESEIFDKHPDILLVLPWHFHEFFLRSHFFKGKTLLFPLPELRVVIA